jgi:uncharacterized protein (DUF58 family)
MITAKGVGFLIAAILVFFLARLTQVGWLYLVDALLWGIILLSAFLPWLGVPFLDARRKLSWEGSGEGTGEGASGPAEGETVQIDLSLRNRGFWPKFFLSLSYGCTLAAPENRQFRFFVSKLAGSSELALPATVAAYQRGTHSLEPVVADASAPFGLFRRRARLDQAQQVLVYPRIYPLNRLYLVDGLAGESVQTQKSRLGLETAGSRFYIPGDPRRHIHWRNTARTGRPMVREFEDPQDHTLHLIFDATQSWGEGRESSLEYSIKLVASVANYARLHRVPVQVWGGTLGAGLYAPLESRGDWQRLLRSLALVEPGQGPSLPQSLGRLPAGSSALAVFSAGERQSARAMSLAGLNLNRLVVVALEGFGEPDSSDDLLDELACAGGQVIRVRPGQLPQALTQLEGLEAPAPLRQRVA